MNYLLKKKPIFLNLFSTKEDIEKKFDIKLTNEIILFASYGCANYSGDAFVLFEKDGKLFEVNGWHCSCYGLEDQWVPEETNIVTLEHRLNEGKLGFDNYSDNLFSTELKAFLKK